MPSFAEARKYVESEGLAYDQEARTGFVLLNSWRDKNGGTVPFCLIAEDIEAGERLKERLIPQTPKR
ncbi:MULTISPECIES: peptide ligase PGM1-related protein [unclassified Streptomyces]|uniref:peptide ligase PGM1-related protein n=1 Tax=unclassified Streptomyces TaxID=2593676 RepID=UPI00093F7E10|nr:peptide ligase PGM1-related protein [Streptomyces sp. TSRI0281]OKI43450.1 hypothetical protein A6A29_09030 [Streptomyces sp. TSRI0281]